MLRGDPRRESQSAITRQERSGEDKRFVNNARVVFLCDFFFELGQFFLDRRVYVSGFLQVTSSKGHLVAIGKHFTIVDVWIGQSFRVVVGL